MSKTLLVLSALLLAASARADTTFVDTSGSSVDTVGLTDTASVDTIIVDTVLYQRGQVLSHYRPVTDSVNLEKRLLQNPTVALFKSALVPGLGQIGNKRYVKATLFLGLDVWFIGSAIHYGRQASRYRDQFESSSEISDRNEYYDLYLDRKSGRNKFTWFAVIVTFVSMFDAYVDAHLSGFPRTADENAVTLDLQASPQGTVAASISVCF